MLLCNNVRCSVMVLLPFLSSATKFGVTILQFEDKPCTKRDFQKNEFFFNEKGKQGRGLSKLFVLKDKKWFKKEEINLDYKR